MKEQQNCNSKKVTLNCVLFIQTLKVVGLCFSDLKLTELHACIIPIENGVAIYCLRAIVFGFIDEVKRRNMLRSLDSCYIGHGCFAFILDISWKKGFDSCFATRIATVDTFSFSSAVSVARR